VAWEKRTIVLVTHDEEAVYLADRAIVLRFLQIPELESQFPPVRSDHTANSSSPMAVSKLTLWRSSNTTNDYAR